MSGADVLVIGGGLHGCSAALHLALRGARVVVVEKDHVARHASGVNAGGVRRLGRHPAEIPLAVASLELWQRIGELVDDPCGFEPVGQVKVAESEADFETLQARVARVRALGYAHEELIDRATLRDVLPAVGEHCAGGILCRDDGAALPYHTTLAFKRKAERLGVRFLEGVRAERLERVNSVWRVKASAATIEADWIVNAAGAWGGTIAAALGEAVPLEAVALMLMITAPVAPFVKPVVGATSRALSFKQYANGTVMIGGGHRGRADPEKNRTVLDFEKLSLSARIASEIFPSMQGVQIMRAWAGIEGRMPDEIPVIGPSTTSERVIHAFGFSAHGFQLGPIVGRIVADLIAVGTTSLPIAPFSIERFSRYARPNP
jgi:glycine/D-amino acid oxidase-like deaminating enzyme